jgi:hypothetical protein
LPPACMGVNLTALDVGSLSLWERVRVRAGNWNPSQ